MSLLVESKTTRDVPGHRSGRSSFALRRRSAQTMLELIAATTIIAIALVPALKATRSSLMNLEHLERNEQLVALCTSMLEREMAATAASWDLSARSGVAPASIPDVRFLVNKSDEASAGGIPGELAVVDVIVWHDTDRGGDLDSDEPRSRLSTKLAKVTSYEYEASVH
jgi:type II secretory pathway pseudopilin PulG